MRGKLVIFLMSGSRTPELAEAAVQGGKVCLAGPLHEWEFVVLF